MAKKVDKKKSVKKVKEKKVKEKKEDLVDLLDTTHLEVSFEGTVTIDEIDNETGEVISKAPVDEKTVLYLLKTSIEKSLIDSFKNLSDKEKKNGKKIKKEKS